MILESAALLLAFIAALGVMLWWRKSEAQRHLLDHPDERSMHENPTMSGGGLAIVAALLVGFGLLYYLNQPIVLPLLAFGLLVVVSFYDDLRDLRVLVRLPLQVVAVLLLVIHFQDLVLNFEGFVLDGLLMMVIVGVAVLWFINLFNFMDGMDGFAGSMALSGFGFIAFLAVFGFGAIELYPNSGGPDALLVHSLCGVIGVLVFLVFNWPPARIFMGDVGSVPVGFALSFCALWGIQLGIFTVLQCAVLFLPFWLDATVTLFRRLLKGEKFWLAHKSHYYQRFVHQGMPKIRVLWLEIFLMLICFVAALGMAAMSAFEQLAVLTVLSVSMLVLWITLDRKLRIRIS